MNLYQERLANFLPSKFDFLIIVRTIICLQTQLDFPLNEFNAQIGLNLELKFIWADEDLFPIDHLEANHAANLLSFHEAKDCVRYFCLLNICYWEHSRLKLRKSSDPDEANQLMVSCL